MDAVPKDEGPPERGGRSEIPNPSDVAGLFLVYLGDQFLTLRPGEVPELSEEQVQMMACAVQPLSDRFK
jgi:hypothetical protein